jgi:hypothetical protein
LELGAWSLELQYGLIGVHRFRVRIWAGPAAGLRPAATYLGAR